MLDALRLLPLQGSPSPERVAILVAPPLTGKRVKIETSHLSLWQDGGPGKRFARSRNLSPEDYDSKIAFPAMKLLLEIKQTTDVPVQLDATFEDFENMLKSGNADVALLFAYRFTARSENGSREDYVEFADRPRPLRDVSRAVSISERATSLVAHFACNTKVPCSETERVSVEGSTAVAHVRVPLLEGLCFARLWLDEMNGNRSVSETYERALMQFISLLD